MDRPSRQGASRRQLTPAHIADVERACGELRGVLAQGLKLEVSAEDHARLRQFVDSVRDVALKFAASKHAPLALPKFAERANFRDILDAAAEALASGAERVRRRLMPALLCPNGRR